jgi:hypothetical protein
MYRSLTAANYATTNQSSFAANSGNVVGSGLIMVIQYASLQKGVTMVTFGDSMMADYAASTVLTANGWGFHARLVELMHSNSIPVEFCNFGWSGQTSTQCLARFQQMAQYVPNTFLCYEGFSPNDYATATPASPANSQVLMTASLASNRANVGLATQLAQQYGMTRTLETAQPGNASSASGGVGGTLAKNYWLGDLQRVAYNTTLKSFIPQGVTLIQPDLYVSGSVIATGNAASQTQYQMTATGFAANFSDPTLDGTHRNDAGNIAAAAGCQPMIQSML